MPKIGSLKKSLVILKRTPPKSLVTNMRAPKVPLDVSTNDQHCFAVYLPQLDHLERALSGCLITDLSVIHRIHNVLRLQVGDTCIVFDDQHHVYATLKEISRKRIVCEMFTKVPHAPLHPSIHWLLPILKREAFDDVLYTLTEMGATTVQPLYTAKTSRAWGSEKDYARARSVMIAAAEQSKQYILPMLFPVQDIRNWKSGEASARIFFDAGGAPLKEVLARIGDDASSFVGCVGPEADLTEDEKQLLKDQGFVLCALTPSILRAKQAIALGLGMLRSYCRE